MKLDLNSVIDMADACGLRELNEGKASMEDYKILKSLAKGGYGEVFIVEKNGKIFAIKRMDKTLILNQDLQGFMIEREIMTQVKSKWLVSACECFQDDSYIYFVMDFLLGGDLNSLLVRFNEIPENAMRFYAAEIICAIEDLHKSGFIHRDLKPDNVFLNSEGHVLLGDFGLSCRKGDIVDVTPVGTTDYLSYDSLISSDNGTPYNETVDLWSFGCILFEMASDSPPFYSDNLVDIYARIRNLEYNNLSVNTNKDLKDLISKLLCKPSERLSFEQVKNHSFFKGIDWSFVGSYKPFFIPSVNGDSDTANFIKESFTYEKNTAKHKYEKFIGFTFDPTHVSVLLSHIEGIEKCSMRKEDDLSLSKLSLKEITIDSSLEDVLSLLEDIKKKSYLLYTQNINFIKDNRKYSEILEENENLKRLLNNNESEDLKRELRIRKGELRDAQRKIDQELAIKNNLIHKLEGYKKALDKINFRNLEIFCKNIYTGKSVSITLKGETLSIDNEKDILLDLVYVQEPIESELKHFKVKQDLCVKIYLLNYAKETSTNKSRRAKQSIQNDLNKEKLILKGINSMLPLLKDKKEAELQKIGSLKKIKQLKMELLRSDDSYIENEEYVEFNNHLFCKKTVAPGTLCEHCHNPITGLVKQAFFCKDCCYVVHRVCYVLGDLSCELMASIRKTEPIFLLCNSISDKKTLLSLKN